MKKRCTLAWALALSCPPIFGGEDARVRVYTNEDLDRLSAERGETGVLSKPATAARATSPASSARGHGEDYWRKEAARVKARVRALEQEAAHLREMIARPAQPGARSSRSRSRGRTATDPNESRRKRLRLALDGAAELQAELEDRARRDGALPGWLR